MADGASRDIGICSALGDAPWYSPSFGVQEIELPPGHDACVLSLVSMNIVEYTADGRGDNGRAFSPSLRSAFVRHAGTLKSLHLENLDVSS